MGVKLVYSKNALEELVRQDLVRLGHEASGQIVITAEAHCEDKKRKFMKSKDSTGSAVTTDLILRLLSLSYGVNHVHIQHRRKIVNKLVPAFNKSGGANLDRKGNETFSYEKQFCGKGGRTIAAVCFADGHRIEAVAITNNQSKFVKSIGYNQAVLNLWYAIQDEIAFGTK